METIDLRNIIGNPGLTFIGQRDRTVKRLSAFNWPKSVFILATEAEGDEIEEAIGDLSAQTDPAAFAELLAELIEFVEDDVRILIRPTERV